LSIPFLAGNVSATKLNRRRLLAAGAGLGLSATGFPLISARAQEDEPPLRILGWGHYFTPEITQVFREAHGVEIEVTPIGAPDDVVLFLRAGGIGLYDLVTPISGLLARMEEEGLIQPVSEDAFPNFGGLFEPFRTSPWAVSATGRLGVPMLWGSLAAAYPAEAAGSAPARWTDLFGESWAKKIVMSDDSLGHFWIWNWAMGAEDPTRVTRDQLNGTTEALISMRKNLATAWDSSVHAAMRRLARGRGMIASIGWQSAPLLSEPGERELAVSHPLPGSASFCDCISLVTDAPRREAALALIDYMITPEVQGKVVSDARWATVTSEAVQHLTPAVAGIFNYADLTVHLERAPIRPYPPFGEDGDIATYLDWVVAWDRVRATKTGG
jgi:spermidine/putrescine transport system substrate-binding protein